MTDTIRDFMTLFQGREDAYGTEDGGAWRPPSHVLWKHVVEDHLQGTSSIGVYPLAYVRTTKFPTLPDLGWVCRWGAIDLDVKGESHKTGYNSAADAYTSACNLRAVLASYGVTSWVEITRSGGFHVWIFASTWVRASIMRRALLVACEVAGVPPTEVNPKSESFESPETLGNYVRLPYPGALGSDPPDVINRRVLDVDGVPLYLETFLADALESLTDPELLEELSWFYKPPAPTINVDWNLDAERGSDLAKAIVQLSGLAYTILRNPPLEGQDRSARLYKLACECKSSGITPEQACAVLFQADLLHGQKYVGRTDCAARIRTTVERAWRNP